LGARGESRPSDTPLARLCRALDEAVGIEDVQIAVPGDHARMAQLLALREEVPASVNRRIGRAKLDVDERIEKTAGDLIVPFDHLEELLACCRRAFERRRLDAAVWGHVRRQSFHPNVLARSFAEGRVGQSCDSRSGPGGDSTRRIAARRTGSRNRVKQQLLEALYGRAGIDEMRAVKRALDRTRSWARGVLFPPSRGA